MAVSRKLTNYLKKNRVSYKTLKHPEAFTAQEIAAAQHIPGKQVVKSVLVKADKNYALAVLPAICMIDFAKLKKIIKCKSIKLATENEVAKIFPDYEIGAMPPFGNLYELVVYAEKSLEEDPEIVFNAGTHKDTVKIKFAAFKKLAKPKIVAFGKRL